MIRRAIGVTGIGLAVWLVACSSDTSGGGASTPEAACDQLVGALCSKLNECVPVGFKVSYKDVADCSARQKDSCLKAANAPSTGATPSQISGCASAYSAASCDTIFAPIEACKTPAGSLADGSPCGDGSQCQGRACNILPDATCGVCATRLAAGADCSKGGRCEEGLSCAPNGKCVAPASAGASCGESQPCQRPLVCSKGTCAAGGAAGATCSADEPCDAVKALFCEPTSKTCKEVKVVNPGETCGFVNATIVTCAAGGDCNIASGSTTGTCRAAAADGAPCAEDGPNCQEPAECVNGVCTISDPGTCK